MTIRGVLLAGAAVLSCVSVMGQAHAQQIFLEIPGVQGEATTLGFNNQIDILAASFAASNPACAKSSISVSELALTKNADRASVDLLVAMRDHTVYPTVTFRFARTDNQVYQKYELSNAAFSTGNSAGGSGARNTEAWTVSFSQVIITYTYFDGSGKPGGTESMTIAPAVCPGS